LVMRILKTFFFLGLLLLFGYVFIYPWFIPVEHLKSVHCGRKVQWSAGEKFSSVQWRALVCHSVFRIK